MLCCLAYLIPGKVGRVIRRVLFPFVALFLVYLAVWTLIVKDLDIKSINQVVKEPFVYVTFNVCNNSFAAITLKDMNILNTSNKRVVKRTRDLPTIIPRYSEERIKVGFRVDEFKTAVVNIKALLTSYEIKSQLR